MENFEFNATVLPSTNICENCGKSDNKSYKVVITKGNKKQERILCRTCAEKAQKMIEKKNRTLAEKEYKDNNQTVYTETTTASSLGNHIENEAAKDDIKRTQQTNNVISIKENLIPVFSNTEEINNDESDNKNQNKHKKTVLIFIIIAIALITVALTIYCVVANNGNKFSSEQEMIDYLEGYWYCVYPEELDGFDDITKILKVEKDGSIKSRDMMNSDYLSSKSSLSKSEIEYTPNRGTFTTSDYKFVIREDQILAYRKTYSSNNKYTELAYTFNKGTPSDFSEQGFISETTTYSYDSYTTSYRSYTTKSSYSSFRNKYGTPTTICAHPGCTNYIASSGDTNCCATHSNKCHECGCYIDEDALFCVSCLKKAASQLQQEYQ